MKKAGTTIACFLLASLPALFSRDGPNGARSTVVINEILYHAPDDLDDLQFIELHNPASTVIDVGGWRLTAGVRYQFPVGARLDAGGYLVLCKDSKLLKKHYGIDAGQFEGSLSHGGEQIALLDEKGQRIDAVKYGTRSPWPVSADGYGPSLERICPSAAGDGPDNWAPSPLSSGSPRPGGTPGKKNAAHSPRLPAIITNVACTPTHAAPGQEITVAAEVQAADSGELKDVELRYRFAGYGIESDEHVVRMTPGPAGRYTGRIHGQRANRIVRFRIIAVDANGAERVFPSANDLRPALSLYVHEPFEPGKLPFGLVINVGRAEHRAGQEPVHQGLRIAGPGAAPPARGNSAFVYVSPKTHEPEVFDFINVTPRTGGRKVRFHKDRMLDGMTTINLIYEYMDRFALAEPLAHELYRKAGNAAPRTDFVRTWIDGRPIGFQLLVEQPNRAFLKHNGLNPDGHLYKCVWFGDGLIGQHEKKTRVHDGHEAMVRLADQLNRTRGDEQWQVIKKNFDVEQVINYFAVNMLLSHWDGYFNNYFIYHDSEGTGKWTIYPWDQDKTWGFHDGIQGFEVFYDMPVTFGMRGDNPRGGGSVWWRPPGHFSGPLLANPRFRKLFLARTRELLETVYTEKVFFRIIKDLGDRLEEEVRVRAQLHGQDPKQAVATLHRNLDSLREHLTKRGKFLREQAEIKNAGPFERSELK